MKKILCRLALVVGLIASVTGRAAETEGNARDVLVYKDGDRVQGRLIEKTDKIIVFESDRFGTLRVLVENAVIIRAEEAAKQEAAKQAAAKAAAPGSAVTAKDKARKAEQAEAEKLSILDHFSPAVLTAELRDFFGPWHGRFAFSLEAVSNATEQNNTGVAMTLTRKWKTDEVELKSRYDFSETNHLATTDLMKIDGLWRHDFPKNYFALYHPNLEWNRASYNNGVPNDYVQLQQEIGAGVSILPTPRRKVRVGLSENLFDVWNTTPGGMHTSRTVESAFIETELKLPWRMNLSERAIYYYSFASTKDGWENHIELSKKFTETLSTSILQETRQYNPDGTTQNYSRLKLLFGVDF